MQKWKTLKAETVFEAAPFVSVVKEQVAVNETLTIDDFYKVNLRPFVTCVPVTIDGKVLMLRQYKHGIGTITLTFPGGFVEPDEAPALACKRELLEETGYESGKFTALGSFVDNGNQGGSHGTYFLASNCKAVQSPNSGDLEEMELVMMSKNQIDKAVMNGEIHLTHHAFAWLLAKSRIDT